MLAASTTETRIGKVLNGFDAELQTLVNAVDIGRHGKEHRVLPVATFLALKVLKCTMAVQNYSKRGKHAIGKE